MNRTKTTNPRVARLRKASAPGQVQNAIGRSTGMGGPMDFGTQQGPVFQYMTPWMQDKYAINLYHTDWQARKIITIPVHDMLREGWTYDGLSQDLSNKLIETQQRLKVLEHFKQAGRLERLVGGAVIYLGVVDGQSDARKPLDVEALDVGCLRFLNVIPRNALAPRALNYDPLSEHYGRPETYIVRGGVEVHHSRFIVFDGDPLLPMPDNLLTPTMYTRNDGFGTSALLPIYDELMRATGTRQAAYQLVQRASVIIAQMDTMDLAGTRAGQQQMAAMADIVNQINVFQGAVIDRQPGDADVISTLSASFGSVPELLMVFLQVLSAASDIPATRFLGQAPGGLNATGESDLENYYGRLASDQNLTLKPQLVKLLEIMGRSVLGKGFKATDLDILFPPLWSLSELEQSQIRTADVNNVVALTGAGLLDDDSALKELAERDALLVDIDEVEPVEVPPGYDPAGQLDAVNKVVNSAEFKEQDHPRAKDGKFGPGGESGKNKIKAADVFSHLADAEDSGGKAKVKAAAEALLESQPELALEINRNLIDLGYQPLSPIEKKKSTPSEKGGESSDSSDRAGIDAPYHRYTRGPKADTGAGYAMFSDDESRVEGTYGKHHHTADPKDFAPGEVVDADCLRAPIEKALRSEKSLLSELQTTAKDLASDVNPEDIVDRAGIWDNPDVVEKIYQKVLEPRGIKAVKTNDGLLVFDPSAIKSHGKREDL